MPIKLLAAAGIVLVLVGIVVAGLFATGILPASSASNTPAVRGEWIYHLGTDRSGRVIPYTAGRQIMALAPPRHGREQPLACTDCHNSDGRGELTRFGVAPDITYPNLTNPAGIRRPRGKRGSRYTDALIERAVVEGIDAGGKRLSPIMPRYRLTGQQASDLVAYLKTLNW